MATQPATVVAAQPAAGGLTRRQPTSTLGMAGDWSCPPTADRKIDASKKDFTLCGALCCSWPAPLFFETMRDDAVDVPSAHGSYAGSLCYMDRDSGCFPFCHGHGQFLCLAKDEVCLDFGEKDKSLACIQCHSGVVSMASNAYPRRPACARAKCGCCCPLSYYYPPEQYPELAPKKDYCPCMAICCGPLCYGTEYLKCPTTCCSHQGYSFGCLYEECVIPCDSSIPCACGVPLLCGCLLFPKFACCSKAGDYFELAPAVGAVTAEPK